MCKTIPRFDMSFDTEKRKLTLQELSDFILSSQYVLDNSLQTIGWDENKLNSVQYKTCPFNSKHLIPGNYLEKHINTCRLKQEGYLDSDDFLPDSGDTAEMSIVLDKDTRSTIIHNAMKQAPEMETILWVVCLFSSYRCDAVCKSHSVPRTSDRIFTSTTPDERLALYDYVIEKTKHRHSHDLPLELPFPDISRESKNAEPESALEVMAKERDAKRRSVSYKRVHTNRKSHTEILREVIQSQMEMMQYI